MTPLQVFRTTLTALAEPASFAKGVYVGRTASENAVLGTQHGVHEKAAKQLLAPPRGSDFRRYFGVVLVDPSGWLNITAGVAPSALAQVCNNGSLHSLVSLGLIFRALHLDFRSTISGNGRKGCTHLQLVVKRNTLIYLQCWRDCICLNIVHSLVNWIDSSASVCQSCGSL